MEAVAVAEQAEVRREAVRQALDTVLDPELDESVVSLGFVDDVTVDGERVAVSFRLPTAWCSLSFAWIMAEDMRAALRALAWVEEAEVRLVDHFSAEAINAGMAAGQGFAATFGADAGGDLAALRRTFRRKAYLGRMADLIAALRADGHDDGAIVALTVADLDAQGGSTERARLIARYLERRAEFGGPAGRGDAAFRTAEGEPIPADALARFLRDIRMTRRSVEANGEMCRVLLAARYGHLRQ